MATGAALQYGYDFSGCQFDPNSRRDTRFIPLLHAPDFVAEQRLRHGHRLALHDQRDSNRYCSSSSAACAHPHVLPRFSQHVTQRQFLDPNIRPASDRTAEDSTSLASRLRASTIPPVEADGHCSCTPIASTPNEYPVRMRARITGTSSISSFDVGGLHVKGLACRLRRAVQDPAKRHAAQSGHRLSAALTLMSAPSASWWRSSLPVPSSCSSSGSSRASELIEHYAPAVAVLGHLPPGLVGMAQRARSTSRTHSVSCSRPVGALSRRVRLLGGPCLALLARRLAARQSILVPGAEARSDAGAPRPGSALRLDSRLPEPSMTTAPGRAPSSS